MVEMGRCGGGGATAWCGDGAGRRWFREVSGRRQTENRM